jgi:hypothetical protein
MLLGTLRPFREADEDGAALMREEKKRTRK